MPSPNYPFAPGLTIAATPPAASVNPTDLVWIWQNGQLLRCTVAQIAAEVPATAPGGSPNQIQFNNAGVFGGFTVTGDATLNPATGALTIVSIGGKSTALLTGLLLVTKNSNYTFTVADVGTEFAHTDASAYTWTIDTFANAPINAGQKIAGFNSSTGTLTIAAPAGGSLLRLDGTPGTGNRTVAASSYFALHKLDNANSWGITGTGLS